MLVSIFLLLFLLPSSFIAIDRAFYTQLVSNAEQKMEVHMYAILSELSVTEDKVELLNNALTPDFYRPDSGLSAYITHEQDMVWQSDSSLNQHFIPPIEALPPGEHLFRQVRQSGGVFWVLSISLLFDAEEYTRPLTVHVVQTEQRLMAPQLAFRATLIQWFIGIGLMLLLLMLLAYYGYIALIAFDKKFLAQPIGAGVTSLGIPIGMGVIIFTIVITGIYVRRANGEFDTLTKEILKDASQ